MSTEDVLNHHLQSFSAGDVDEMIKDYTDESVLITPEGIIRGREELRTAFGELLSGLFKPGTYTFEMDRLEIVGEVAFIAWHSTNEGAEVPLGTDTFLVRDGKIAVQTFAASVQTS